MQKAVLWVKKLKVTQGMNGSFSHNGELAIDMGGVCEYLKAPFDCTVMRTYEKTNTVWVQSDEPVLYADGTVDYMTVMTHHDNDISDIFVGKKIKQGEIYYHPGVKGYATGSHIHIGVGKGKFTGNGWHKGEYQPKIDGYAWPINNQYDIVKALFLYDKVEVEYAMYDWTKTDTLTTDDKLKHKLGEVVEINGVYKSSMSTEKLTPKIKVGTITKIVETARNPYLLDNGNIGWTNDNCIVETPKDYKKLYEEELEKNKILEAENVKLQDKIKKAIEDLTC